MENKNKEFNFDGYEIVRTEFFAHSHEPLMTFGGDKVYFNTACLKKLPDVFYIQFLVNSAERRIVIKPCGEDERDSHLWRLAGDNRHVPRKISCRFFWKMISELMNWNYDCRYKISGNVIRGKYETVLLFDLTAAQIYGYIGKSGNSGLRKAVSVFPEDWKDSFGLPVDKHNKINRINVFDGYTVFSVNDKENKIIFGSGENE